MTGYIRYADRQSSGFKAVPTVRRHGFRFAGQPVSSSRNNQLLQVPFFIAAYHFLSHLQLLNGAPFGFIRDLGIPDGAAQIGIITLNVLPLIMTLVNVVATFIYLRDSGRKERIQLLITALVFLLLLYRSPAGLVLYWTCNNLFSLGKNLIKLVMDKMGYTKQQAERHKDNLVDALKTEKNSLYDRVFWCNAALLALLASAIPIAIIYSSTNTFTELSGRKLPEPMVLRLLLVSAGMFLIWGGCFFLLSSRPVRKVLACAFWTIGMVSMFNYLTVREGRTFGHLSSLMVFDKEPFYDDRVVYVNLVLCIMIAGLAIFLFYRFRRLVLSASAIIVVSLILLTSYHFYEIHKEISSFFSSDYISTEEDVLGQIPLSRNGRNVILLMLDRGLSAMVPYIMAEKPELEQTYEGFVYYPNTVSFGAITAMGAPGIYGGYEYTPDAMNARSDEKLVDKHNEALRVLPVLFSENDYAVTVCDPSWAGYKAVPDLSIYEGYNGIQAYNLEGVFSDPVFGDAFFDDTQLHNLFFYGLFRMIPTVGKHSLYDQGSYRGAIADRHYTYGEFKVCYPVMSRLSELMCLQDEGNTFLMMASNITHPASESVQLQLPDYEPAESVDNQAYNTTERYDNAGNRMELAEEVLQDGGSRFMHYTVNMSALLLVGNWLEWMKAEGVYDNTRIIIVADHGEGFRLFPEVETLDISMLNAIYMFKDFDAQGALRTDEAFMTNADTPYLATKGLFDAINPFTGRSLMGLTAPGEKRRVTNSLNWLTDEDGTRHDVSDAAWYTVHDNIFIESNWERVED